MAPFLPGFQDLQAVRLAPLPGPAALAIGLVAVSAGLQAWLVRESHT